MRKFQRRQIPQAIRLAPAAEYHQKFDAGFLGGQLENGNAVRRRFVGNQGDSHAKPPLQVSERKNACSLVDASSMGEMGKLDGCFSKLHKRCQHEKQANPAGTQERNWIWIKRRTTRRQSEAPE
ncbi:hypothetical protein [Noviherbaspirillum malthae]|uniref:hypothetical protein n=1 Tax=Noviherbaspirillum malthae TaxID=1260987 RepID=UPI001890410D|nr:hypothetical protein [Noviherbaspirillum malthae]